MIGIWLGAILLFAALEAATTALVSVWFVVGAAAALLGVAFHASVLTQAALFVVVSAISLVATRPLVRRFANRRTVPTNADRVLGQEAQVTEEIDNEHGAGAVYVDGKTWTARSLDGAPIAVGEAVRVLKIEGVKLFVEKLENMEVTEKCPSEQL